jgi:2-(1,2-epoxy-1,2-dihydrophenyl)acetyl-CoA isomerase
MNTATNPVIVTEDNGIATLLFNRPAVYNAMNNELMLAFRDATVALANRSDIRVLILKGAGKAFLAGGDVASFHAQKDDPDLAANVKPMGDTLHDGIMAIRNMPFPVIAEIQGACAGAGVSVALACDFAIASDKATFNTAYTKIGLSPDGGSTWFLPRMIGIKKTAELIMLSDMVNAETALQLGLVNRVVAADTLSMEVNLLAARLANGATLAYANAKRLLNKTFETPMRAHLDEEIRLFAECVKTADFKEGVTAFVEKRKPTFTGK